MSAIISAIAEGLIDGGAQKVYGFPGFYSEDILELIDPIYRISVNERVAYAEAYGACVGGVRSVVSFKSIGLSVASDAYSHSIIGGVNAGMVIVVTDDIEVWGSQERQDSRALVDLYGGMLYEPESLQSAYKFAKDAFDISEKLDIPVVIRLTNQTLKLEGQHVRDDENVVTVDKRQSLLDHEKFVVHPYYFHKQYDNLLNKKRNVQSYVDSMYAVTDNFKNESALIRFGLGNDLSSGHKHEDILQINTVPIPRDPVEIFVKNHLQVRVSESGDAYAYDHIAMLMADSGNILRFNQTPHHTIKFTKWTRYSDLFKAIKQLKEDTIVVGDITQFTVESEDAIDVALSMGASIPVAIGVAEVRGSSIAVVGDCSFNHEGIQVIYEGMNRNVNTTVIIIDNGVSWCTGGQENSVQISQLDIPSGVNYKRIDYVAKSISLKKELQNSITSKGFNIVHIVVPVGSLERE